MFPMFSSYGLVVAQSGSKYSEKHLREELLHSHGIMRLPSSTSERRLQIARDDGLIEFFVAEFSSQIDA